MSRNWPILLKYFGVKNIAKRKLLITYYFIKYVISKMTFNINVLQQCVLHSLINAEVIIVLIETDPIRAM